MIRNDGVSVFIAFAAPQRAYFGGGGIPWFYGDDTGPSGNDTLVSDQQRCLRRGIHPTRGYRAYSFYPLHYHSLT